MRHPASAAVAFAILVHAGAGQETQPATTLSPAQRLEKDVVAACEGKITVRPQAAKKVAAAGVAAVPVVRAYAKAKGRNALSPSLVEALGSIRGDGGRGEEPRRFLLELLEDRGFFWRPQAVRALGEQGRPEDLALLRKLLEDQGGVVRAAAAEALARRNDKESAPLLRKRLGDHDYRVRLKTAAALAKLGDECGLPVLVEILKMDQEFFGDPFGFRARTEAFQVLRGIAGDDFGYAPAGDDAARTAAVEKFERWARERLGGDYRLEETARYVPDPRQYAFGLELRTCNLGEAWLRLDSQGELALGLERPVRIPVPPAAADAIRRTAAAVPASDRRVFGTVVCDFERLCGVGGDGKATAMSAPASRPADITPVVKAFIEALRRGGRDDLAAGVQERAEMFGAL